MASPAEDQDPVKSRLEVGQNSEFLEPSPFPNHTQPQFHPSSRDLTSAQHFRNATNLTKELRSMELVAYCSVVNAYRGAGHLTPDKSEVLAKLRKSFNIPLERHLTELRRAANDPRLEQIAKEVTGQFHTVQSWISEGYTRTPQLIPLVPLSRARIKVHNMTRNVAEVFLKRKPTNGMDEKRNDLDLQEELINEEDKKEITELLKLKSGAWNDNVQHESNHLPQRETSPDIVSFSRVSKGPSNKGGTSFVRSISTSLNDLKHLLTSPKSRRRRRSESPSSDSSSSSSMSINDCINEIRIGIINHKQMSLDAEPLSSPVIPTESPIIKRKRGRVSSAQNQNSSVKEPVKRRRKQKQSSLPNSVESNQHTPTTKFDSLVSPPAPIPYTRNPSMPQNSGYPSPNIKSPLSATFPQPLTSPHNLKPKVPFLSTTSPRTSSTTTSIIVQSTPPTSTTASSSTSFPIPTPKKRTQNLTPSTYTPMAVEEPVILTKLEAQRQEQEELHQQMQLMKKMSNANNAINPPVLSHHQPIVIQQLLAAQAQAQQQGGQPTLGLPMSAGGIGSGNVPNTGLFRKSLHPHILSSPGGNKRGANAGGATPGGVPATGSAPRPIQPQAISIAPSIGTVSTSTVNVISSNYIVVHKNNNNLSNNTSTTIPMPTFKPLSTPCILPSTLQQLQVLQGNPGSNNTINVLNSTLSTTSQPPNPSGTKAVILRRSNNLVYLDLQNSKPQTQQVQNQPQQFQRIISTANFDPSKRILYQKKPSFSSSTTEIRPLNITKGHTGTGVISTGSLPAVLGGSTVITSCASPISLPILPSPKNNTTSITEKQIHQQPSLKPTTLLMPDQFKLTPDTVTVATPTTSAIIYGSNNNNNNRTMFTVRIDKSVNCISSNSGTDIRKFNNQSPITSQLGIGRSNTNNSNNLHFEEDEEEDGEEEEEDYVDDEGTGEEDEIELIDLVEESSSQEGSEEIPISSKKLNDNTNHNTNGKAEVSDNIARGTSFCSTNLTGPPPLLPIDSFVDSSTNVIARVMSSDKN